MKTFASLIIAAPLFVSMAASVSAAEAPTHDHAAVASPSPDVHCVPVAERAGAKLGCWVTGSQVLGELPNTPLYWHLYEYPSRAAAQSARGQQGSVVESYGKVWLFNIADEKWAATGGKKVARVGPLPIAHGGSFTATYMEATFVPGMSSHVHRHAGPEAWYVLSGAQCLKTPSGTRSARAGATMSVTPNLPMELSVSGAEVARSLTLVIHDSTQNFGTASTWKPTDVCHP